MFCIFVFIVQNYVFLACTVIHPHLMYILKINLSCLCIKLNVDMCSFHLRTSAEIHPGFPEGCRKTVPRTVMGWLVLIMIVPPTCTPTIYQREHWKGKHLCWEPRKEATSGLVGAVVGTAAQSEKDTLIPVLFCNWWHPGDSSSAPWGGCVGAANSAKTCCNQAARQWIFFFLLA